MEVTSAKTQRQKEWQFLAVEARRVSYGIPWDPVDFQDSLSHIEIRFGFVYMLSSVAVHDIEQPNAKTSG